MIDEGQEGFLCALFYIFCCLNPSCTIHFDIIVMAMTLLPGIIQCKYGMVCLQPLYIWQVNCFWKEPNGIEHQPLSKYHMFSYIMSDNMMITKELSGSLSLDFFSCCICFFWCAYDVMFTCVDTRESSCCGGQWHHLFTICSPEFCCFLLFLGGRAGHPLLQLLSKCPWARYWTPDCSWSLCSRCVSVWER